MSLFDTTINELGATTGLAMTQALNEVIAQVERAKSDAWRIRKQSTAYTVGDIVIVPGLKNHGLALECMQEGTSWPWELELTEPTVGDVIDDNTIQWKVIPMVSAVGGLTPEQIATELSSLEQDLNDTITQTAQSLSSAISQAETNAKDYTDDTEANLSSAISTAETNAKGYTDDIAENLTEAISTAETNAKGYTDTKTANLLPLEGGTITGSLEVNGDLTKQGNDVLSMTDKEKIVGWGMPDYSAGVAIQSGASVSYTAPCDGIAMLTAVGGTRSYVSSIKVNNVDIPCTGGTSAGEYNAFYNIPLCKNDILSWTAANSSVIYGRTFYPLKGA